MNQITSLFYSLLAAWAETFKGEYNEVKPRAEKIAEDTKASLATLAENVAKDEIKLEDAPKHLEQELLLLKTQGIELAIVGVSFAEEQFNEWSEKLKNAFDGVLPKQN